MLPQSLVRVEPPLSPVSPIRLNRAPYECLAHPHSLADSHSVSRFVCIPSLQHALIYAVSPIVSSFASLRERVSFSGVLLLVE